MTQRRLLIFEVNKHLKGTLGTILRQLATPEMTINPKFREVGDKDWYASATILLPIPLNPHTRHEFVSIYPR